MSTSKAIHVWRLMAIVPLNKPVTVVSLGFIGGVDNSSIPIQYDGKITDKDFKDAKDFLSFIIESDSVEDFEIYRYLHCEERVNVSLPIITILDGGVKAKYRVPIIMQERWLEMFDGVMFYNVRKQVGVQKDDLVPFKMTFYLDKEATSTDPRVPVLKRLADAIRSSEPLPIHPA